MRLATLAMLAALAMPIAPAAAGTAAPSGTAPARTWPAADSHTPNPTTVTIAGSFQSEVGCPGDWQPDCATTHMTFDASDDVWQLVLSLPAGAWEYKAALNDSWTETYGAGGGNATVTLADPATVKFYYDHKSHWITSNRTARIVTAAGSFQSSLGCPGDWQPDCLRSWLQDIDGDGTYTFRTTAIPAGDYATKATINESWSEAYPGSDLPFTVPYAGALMTFKFVSSTNTLTVTAQAPYRSPGTVEWDGLRHDSRNKLYRTPGGAVQAGTPVRIRFRTFHDDVTSVVLRVYDINANGQRLVPMTIEAGDVACYQPALAPNTCDLWGATLSEPAANDLWYRFIVTDDDSTAYYADDTSALDGGLGAPTGGVVDTSWALTVYKPGFTRPAWAANAVMYQIFPDRFRNGDPRNDPETGDPRYDDLKVAAAWGSLPEGYCRNYDGVEGTACTEDPSGRDYQGGDLQGVIDKLGYLKSLGVNTLYFNPIFFARSNHRYDTADYYQIDPELGTNALFRELATKANAKGMRIVLDGVFNHMSSDSPRFDRYGHYPTTGACESAASTWRDWFFFVPPAGSDPSPCAPSTPGGSDTFYDGWFGFDSIPVLNKSLPAVQNYFLDNTGSVSKFWLRQGASGWRLDVMGDPSFPAGYWENFRDLVKAEDPQALIISETWQKDSTLLQMLRGERADGTMNYRLRDAVLGLLAPGPFDAKGFPASGNPISARDFASRMASVYEDYAPAADASLMNLLDSHDTERALWTLTPGDETRADKELDATNLAEGKRRLRLASLIQFTVPGMPTVYYGDEAGVTGDDDPDDRRAYPWPDTGGTRDESLLTHYKRLGALRNANPALTAGAFQSLLADDARESIAYGMFTSSQAAVVAVNRSGSPQTLTIPVGHRVPNGTAFHRAYQVQNPAATDVTVASDAITVTLQPLSGLLLLTDGGIDLAPPAAPTVLAVSGEADESVDLSWHASTGAVAYNVYRSPVAGGGFVSIGTISGTTYHDAVGLSNGIGYHYAVEAVDADGLRSVFSNEVVGLPHLVIAEALLDAPATLTHVISTEDRTNDVTGLVDIPGSTGSAGATLSLQAQLGWGPDGSSPAENSAWRWVDAPFDTDVSGRDRFIASLLPDKVGEFDYAYRFTTTGGRDWIYADRDGAANGYSPAQAGALTVSASSDATPPATPTNLHFTSASPAGVALDWDDVADADLAFYRVRRSSHAGGPYLTIATVEGSSYTDAAVIENATYYYIVRALDTSFNRSGDSNEVQATAELRHVTLTFNVTVPATTDGTGRSVYIAGYLDRLDGDLPQWDAGGVVLTRVDATHWTIVLSGAEGTPLEYKYTVGDWDHDEEDAGCVRISNRQLTLTYGSDGQQIVNDTVPNWRLVAPCGA